MKINCDGAKTQHNGKSSAGGVLQDHQGNWLGGFMLNLGSCSVLEAEIKGALKGLQLCVERDFSRVQVECDNLEAVQLFTICPGDRRASREIHLCHSLMKSFEDYTVTHIYREANSLADQLSQIRHGSRKCQAPEHGLHGKVVVLSKFDQRKKW